MTSLFRNASWGAIAAGVRLFFGMANLFLAIKLVGSANYGYFALIVSFTTFYVTLVNSVHTIAVTHAVDYRGTPDEKEKLGLLFSSVFIITLAAVFILVLLIGLFGHGFIENFIYRGNDLDEQLMLKSLLLITLYIAVFQLLTGSNVAVVESLGRFDNAARMQMYGPVLIFVLLAHGYVELGQLTILEVAKFIAIGSVCDFIFTGFVRVRMKYIGSFVPNKRAVELFPVLFRDGLSLQGARLVNVFFDPFNKYLLNRFVGSVAVTNYEIAMKIVSGIQGLFGGAFRTFLQLTERMSFDGSNDYIKTIKYGLTPALIIHGIGGISIVAIKRLWISSDLSHLTMFYLSLVPASLVIIFIAPIYYALIGVRDVNFIFRMNFNLACLNILGSAIFIPIFGIYGASIGFTIAIAHNAILEYKRYIIKVGPVTGLNKALISIKYNILTGSLICFISLICGEYVKSMFFLILLESVLFLMLLMLLLREPLTKKVASKFILFKK